MTYLQTLKQAAIKMYKLPDNVQEYSRTKVFSTQSVPTGLLNDHSTKEGVWGRLVVDAGQILYTITEPGEEESMILEQHQDAVIAPTQLHKVELLTPDTEFHVEFMK